MQTKYKVISEYERFYLCEHPSGDKECFNKIQHHPDSDGYITIFKTETGSSDLQLNPEKINKSFNKRIFN